MSLPLIESADVNRPAGVVAEQILKHAQSSMRQAYRQWREPNPNAGPVETIQQEELLHDFRVELRRLRVWVHQTRTLVRTRHQARMDLRSFAQGTNPSRDLEVILGLLESWHTDRKPQPDHPSPLLDPVLRRINRLEGTTESLTLTGLSPRSRKGKHPAFGVWLSMQIGAQHQMIRYQSQQSDAELHQARIHVKHLRYLIEPLANFTGAAELIDLLKQMQNRLGTLHDLAVMRTSIPEFVAEPLVQALESTLTAASGRRSVELKRIFADQREEVVDVIRWQSDRYQENIKAWQKERDSLMQQLERGLESLCHKLQESPPPGVTTDSAHPHASDSTST